MLRVLVILILIGYCNHLRAAMTPEYSASLQNETNWELSPSFKFDTLCFLNTLTGDPYYLEYYKDEYARMEPRLTPAARTALYNLKRISVRS